MENPKVFCTKTTVTNSIKKDQWYQHFYNVFNTFFDNDSNGIDDDEVDDVHGYDENGDSENDDIAALECDITEGEVYEAIRMLKNGKAAGPDLIIGEFFKNSATHVVPFLVRYFNKLFSSGLYPDNIFSRCLRRVTLKYLTITESYLF